MASTRFEFERNLNARHAAIMEAHSDLGLSRQLEGIRTAATSLAPTYPTVRVFLCDSITARVFLLSPRSKAMPRRVRFTHSPPPPPSPSILLFSQHQFFQPYKYMTEVPYQPRSRSATNSAARMSAASRSTYYPMAFSRRENPYWHNRVPYHPRTYGYYSTLSQRGVMTGNDYPIRAAVVSSSLDQGLPAYYQLPVYHPQGIVGINPRALGM